MNAVFIKNKQEKRLKGNKVIRKSINRISYALLASVILALIFLHQSTTGCFAEPTKTPTPTPTIAPEEVNFTDHNLEAEIRRAIDKPEGTIHASDLEQLTSFVCRRKGVASISGIECCNNLIELDLDHNEITDISPISSLSNLSVLDLSFNNISDISPISGLTNLSTFDLSCNKISDISPLSGPVMPSRIFLIGNEISDISPLLSNNWSSLTHVALEKNPLSATSINQYVDELWEKGVMVTYIVEPLVSPGAWAGMIVGFIGLTGIYFLSRSLIKKRRLITSD